MYVKANNGEFIYFIGNLSRLSDCLFLLFLRPIHPHVICIGRIFHVNYILQIHAFRTSIILSRPTRKEGPTKILGPVGK